MKSAQVRRLMDLLGDKDREILWMRHFDGLTFREAAEALGLTEDAVVQRHVRAVRRFKKLWESLRRPGETDP